MVRLPWVDAPRSPRRWQVEAFGPVFDALRRGERPVVHAVMGAGKATWLAEAAWLAMDRLEDGERILVSTPTVALVDQLAATIAGRCGGDDVGRYYTHAKEHDRRIVVVCNASMGELAALWDAEGVRCRLWLADEAHKTEADAVKEAVAVLRPARAVGCTGTPFRSEVRETLSLWDSLAYSYGLADALADGVLVPWDTPVTWDGTGRDKADVNGICMDLIASSAPPGPGIVSAMSIEDAEQVAEALDAEGIRAAAIHSRLPRARQQELLAALHRGDLRCLVHVALLAEGVDLPWLRWMCLRRPVQARVRFLQEVGRALRSEPPDLCPPGVPPKARAVFIDPFNLFDQHGLSHPAALGEALACAVEVEEEADEEFPLLDLPPKVAGPLPKAVAVDALGAWARRVVSILELAGMFARDPRWGQDGPWRRRGVSPTQSAALARLAWVKRHFPAEHRETLARVCAAPGSLRQGIASDLISALRAVADAAASSRQPPYPRWTWPETLELPVVPDRVLDAATEAAALASGDVLPMRRRA